MAFQKVFERYELKYLLTREQKAEILRAMEPYMEPDEYGRTVIRSLYFDTDNYRLIRHSIEKPAYKEKLRIRSYGKAEPDSMVFVELKKKYKHIVYKRRISMGEHEAMELLSGGGCSGNSENRKKSVSDKSISDKGISDKDISDKGASDGADRISGRDAQISKEVDYFLKYYGSLHPAALVSCEREAFCSLDGSDFRVTFDDTILYRQKDLSLESGIYGEPLLPEGMVLMELKCPGAIPMWMVRTLSKEHVYKTSFSKYGTAYCEGIFPHLTEEEVCHV